MIRKFMNWLFGKKPAIIAKVKEVKPQLENVKANIADVVKIIDAIEAKTEKLVAQETKQKQEQPRSNQPKENKPQPKMNAEPKKDQPWKGEATQSNQNPTNDKPATQKSTRRRKPKNHQAQEKKN